jgi:quercetin dioxygenase-like cupin family protein
MKSTHTLLAFALLPALSLAAGPATAQPAAPAPLFRSGADIAALIAQAKANQKSPTTNSVVTLVAVPHYRVQLEYRTGLTPPTVHHGQAELVHVLKGSANLATGGHLTGVRPGPSTDIGTGIAGATTRHIVEGDYAMVPADTAHQFQDIYGEFVIMSVHLLMPPS